MKKRILISVLGVVLSGFLIFGAVSYFNHQTELKRNREYETSLAKALKNSYKDIKEIQFSNPSYSEKPGGWGVDVTLIFSDRTRVKYQMIHDLELKQNYSSFIGGANSEEIRNNLKAKEGQTNDSVKIQYSTKEEERQ